MWSERQEARDDERETIDDGRNKHRAESSLPVEVLA